MPQDEGQLTLAQHLAWAWPWAGAVPSMHLPTNPAGKEMTTSRVAVGKQASLVTWLDG